MPKLLIADYNEDFRLALAQALREQFQVQSCGTGTEALEILRREFFDVLVLDLMLPEIDGLTLLEQICDLGIFPRVLAFDPLLSPYVQDSLQRLGVSYGMRKPCELAAVTRRIIDLCQNPILPIYHNQLEARTAELLNTLNFRSNHDGFDYLCKGIPLLVTDPAQKLSKELYPAIGKLFSHSGENIERSIRNAIEVAWANRDKETWAAYFPNLRRKPTNALFLSTMVKQLRPKEE